MSFFSDALRVVGCVAAPVLAVTGVGAPLAVAIGAVVAGSGNFAADKIDQGEARKRADEAAAQAKREADAKIQQQKAEADATAARVKAELDKKLEQEALPGRILDACRSENVSQIPALLQRLTTEQFNLLGNNPIAECPSADSQQLVMTMLQAERSRRG